KTFEHVLKGRLEWWGETSGKIPEYQYGFRKNKSTMDCLSQVVIDIYRGWSEKKQTVAVSLDIHAAYDNVQLHILDQILSETGISSLYRKILYSLCTPRSLYLPKADH